LRVEDDDVGVGYDVASVSISNSELVVCPAVSTGRGQFVFLFALLCTKLV
jgi:hypothetical protein